MELPNKLQEVSLEEKPAPETWTFDPACAEAGLNAIEQPLGQVRETELEPEATFVVNVCVT